MSPLYDHDEISRSYFFPMPAPPLPTSEHAGPVPLRLPDGTAVGGYWSRPLSGAPSILYLHGNGECIAHQLDHWPAWARGAGANIFFVDYPGYASSAGQPTLSGCCHAARAALDHLIGQPADVAPSVVVMGRSVGSIFALDAAAAAASPRVSGLVLESGIADVRRRLDIRVSYEQIGVDRAAITAELERDFDHQAKISGLDAPALILHTVHDGLVPAWNGEQLARWAGDRLHDLVLFNRGDHNSIQLVNAHEYRQRLTEFIAAVS